MTRVQVGSGIIDIINNVNVITANIAASTSSFNKPALLLAIIFILLLLLVVVVLFALLRVRREVHKSPPIKLRRRRKNRNSGGKYRIDPLTARPESTSIDIHEPTPSPPNIPSSSLYMRKPDTLV